MFRRHDFTCPLDQRIFRDAWVHTSISVYDHHFHCPDCGSLLVWIPQIARMDAYEPFQKFEVTVAKPGGGTEVVCIDSLHKLRSVERESEVRARNGEGQPLIWRDYAQDQSNKDVHTLGTDPSFPAEELRRRRAAKPGFDRIGVGDPTLAPGAVELSPLEAIE